MHSKQNNKESKTYVQGLRPFGKTLPRGIKGILKKNGYNYSEIISKWNILVGSKISSFCYPKSIKTYHKNKSCSLILCVERGNEINVEYSKKEIINKINSYFGYKLIDEVRLIKSNSIEKRDNYNKKNNLSFASKKFKKKINEISNKDLRDSLSKLLDVAKK